MAKSQFTINIEREPFTVQSDLGFTHFDCDLTFEVDHENDELTPIEFSDVWLFRGKNAGPECLSSFSFKFGGDGCDLDSISEAIRRTSFESEMRQEIEHQKQAELERKADAAREAVLEGGH